MCKHSTFKTNMHKLLSFAIALVLILVSCSLIFEAQTFALTTNKYEFNDKTAGQSLSLPWVTSGTVVAATDPFDSSNITIKVSDATNRSSSKATLLFDRTYEKTTISFDILVPTLSEWTFGVFPDNSQDYTQISLMGDNNGQLTVYDYSQAVNVGEYPVNEWFNLTFEIDPSIKEFSVFLNELKLLNKHIVLVIRKYFDVI